MASLGDVFRVLETMRDEGVVLDYAIGGATAVLFYAEPTRTYDVGVFVLLPSAEQFSIDLLTGYMNGRKREASRSMLNTSWCMACQRRCCRHTTRSSPTPFAQRACTTTKTWQSGSWDQST